MACNDDKLNPIEFPLGLLLCQKISEQQTPEFSGTLLDLYNEICLTSIDLTAGVSNYYTNSLSDRVIWAAKSLVEPLTELFWITRPSTTNQIHYGTEKFNDAFWKDIQNAKSVGGKPVGGLWTSSPLLNDHIDGWKPLIDSGYITPNKRQIREILPGTPQNTFTINSFDDWRALYKQFPRHASGVNGIDWEKAAQTLHAVRITPEGVFKTSHYNHNLIARDEWDTESTLWLHSPLYNGIVS